MKKILITLLVVLTILSLPLQSFADKERDKGPSSKAYKNANDNASFKRDDKKHKDSDGVEGLLDRMSKDDDDDSEFKDKKGEKGNKDKKSKK